MSDQPKPTGQRLAVASEWTVDDENKQLVAPNGQRFSVGFASMDSIPLAKLINAALAAEREKYNRLSESETEQWEALGAKLNTEIQQLREQLAAALEALRKILTAVGSSEMVDIADAALVKIGAK